MNTQKIVLGVLGVAVVLGIWYAAVKTKTETMEQGNGYKPVEVPKEPEKNPVNNSAKFNQTITLRLYDKITFSDGLSVILKEINDSRCPKDVQCIWAGELSGSFTVSGGKLTTSSVVRLGTGTIKNMTLEGYTFSLKDATSTSMTIVVAK